MTAPHIVLVGLGVIGSHLVPHLGRMVGLRRITLVDPDHYDASNLTAQDIEPGDVGRLKVRVQAARLRRMRPDLSVNAIAQAVEHVPLGRLRSSLALAGLDSRLARLHLNQIVRRLGIPWLDAGIEASQRLVRLSSFSPIATHACMECAWDDREYETLEQAYPCRGGEALVPASGATSGLGALAASLLAVAAEAQLEGRAESDEGACTTIFDAVGHQSHRMRIPPNAGCRMPDHTPWTLVPLAMSANDLSVADLLLAAGFATGADVGLRVAGSPFAVELECSRCDRGRIPWTGLAVRLHRHPPQCDSCGAPLLQVADGLRDRLAGSALTERVLDSTLDRLGVRSGDIVSVDLHDVHSDARHFVIGNSAL